MAELIQLRRGDAAEWAAANPVLAAGEPGVEIDTGKQKIGDGTTAWNDLSYGGAGAVAGETAFTPTGNLAATDVQAAIAELDTEKAANGHTHTAADVGAIASTEKGAANGVASLGADGKVPSSQLPASGGTGDSTWTTVSTLSNGWANYGSGYGTVAYRKDGQGFVHLRGVITGGTFAAIVFTLPAGYRPAAKTLHAAGSNGTQMGRVDVLTTGGVEIRGNGTVMSLDGTTFLAEQ